MSIRGRGTVCMSRQILLGAKVSADTSEKLNDGLTDRQEREPSATQGHLVSWVTLSKIKSAHSDWLTGSESPMTSPPQRPWPFVPTLRLAALAMIVALVSLMVEGWIGTVLMILALLLAVWGVIGYVKAWRTRSKLTGSKP
jgi:hypothetical protein